MINIKERNLNELNVFKYDYMPLTYWKNWFGNIKQFFRNIKWAWQRATKGYCDRDTWNLDSYYLQLFYHTLKQLAKNANGYPGFMDYVDILPNTDIKAHAMPNTDIDNVGYNKWQLYLSTMADHFENAQEWNEDIEINKQANDFYDRMDSFVAKRDFVKVKDSDKYTLVKSYIDEEAYNKLAEEWRTKLEEAADYREEEKNIAFDMMKKYFFNLWD